MHRALRRPPGFKRGIGKQDSCSCYQPVSLTQLFWGRMLSQLQLRPGHCHELPPPYLELRRAATHAHRGTSVS